MGRSKRSRPKRRHRHRGERRTAAIEESRAVEFVTVFWMLTLINALFCELGAAAVRWYRDAVADTARIEMLGVILLVAATFLGIVLLILTAVVLRIRRQPPPHGITVFAILIGAAPFIYLVFRPD